MSIIYWIIGNLPNKLYNRLPEWAINAYNADFEKRDAKRRAKGWPRKEY